MEKGTEELKAGNYEVAIDSFNTFIQETEDLELKDPEDEVKKQNNISQADRGIAIALFEQEKYEEAAEAFERAYSTAVETGSTDTPVLCRFLAVCYMEAEDYESALTYLNAVSEKDYKNMEPAQEGEEVSFDKVFYEIGKLKIECYEKLADWESALKQTEALLLQYPDDAELLKEAEFLRTRQP